MSEHKQLQIRMSADTRRRFKLYATEHDTTMQELINNYIASLLGARTDVPQARIITPPPPYDVVTPANSTRKLGQSYAVPKQQQRQRFKPEPLPASLPDDAFDASDI